MIFHRGIREVKKSDYSYLRIVPAEVLIPNPPTDWLPKLSKHTRVLGSGQDNSPSRKRNYDDNFYLAVMNFSVQ